MNRVFTILIFSWCFVSGNAQTIKELTEKRTQTLEEIQYFDKMLQETASQKSNELNNLKIIGSRISLREQVIDGYSEQMNLVNEKIELNRLAVSMLEYDLEKMKSEYADNIRNAYRVSKQSNELVFLLSAKDFNQGYKRIKYLQQASEYRRIQVNIIEDIRTRIEEFRLTLEDDLRSIVDLKSGEEKQKERLKQEQDKKKKMVTNLSSKEKQLKKELEEKKRAAAKIESEIAKLIEEERKRNAKSAVTPEMKLIGDNFADNKGRLPWPVDKGIVTSRFGPQKHPVLTYVTENNIGIEITSENRTVVRSVFKGEVAQVFAIPGFNWAVIIRHGRYMTVYQNLVNLKIKVGDTVETKQEIGDVFCDTEDGNRSILKFMIFDETEKLDPESWITKRR
ncbi:MAG: peptidoglycan DD-metalloendopeptidase family protein [Bacteroidales bacterium]